MIRHESIQLKVLTLKRDFENNICSNMSNNISERNEEEWTDIYREFYPDLKLTKEEAIARSRKFKIIQRQTQKKSKSKISEYSNPLNIWKSVNKVISRNYGEDMCSYFKINVWITLQIVFLSLLSISFVIIPIMIINFQNLSVVQYIYQLISPDQRWLADTPVFYGFYNQSISNETTFYYSIGRAYFCVNVICRVFYILCLIRKFIFNVGAIYATGIELKQSLSLSLLFGLWNFNLRNNRDVEYSKMYIQHFIKKNLSKDTEQKTFKILRIILINIFCYGISFLILERISWQMTTDEKYIQSHSNIPQWLILRVPITVSICVICATWLFDFVQCIETFQYEHYKLYSSAIRIITLNVAVLVMLNFHWTKIIWCVNNNQISCSLLRDKIIINPKSLLQTCWETWLGQRILMYFLTFISIAALFTIVIDVIKSLFKYLQLPIIKPKFFQLSQFSNICFLDCLFWLGFYYVPVLPIIYLFILLLTYFYNIGMISVSCFPSSSSVDHAKRFKTIFLLMLLISLIIAFASLIYQSVAISPSVNCGPFQNLTHNYASNGFSFSDYFHDQNFVLKVINIGSDILFNNNGIWYSIIIIILSLFFQYLFRAMAVSEIRNYVNYKLADMREKKLSLLEDLKLKMRTLNLDAAVYHPEVMKDNNLDIFFEQFSI